MMYPRFDYELIKINNVCLLIGMNHASHKMCFGFSGNGENIWQLYL